MPCVAKKSPSWKKTSFWMEEFFATEVSAEKTEESLIWSSKLLSFPLRYQVLTVTLQLVANISVTVWNCQGSFNH